MSDLKEKVVECKQCLNPNLKGIHTCDIYKKQQEEMNKYGAMLNKVESELKTNWTNSYTQNYSFKETCPCCGYCPHCGRKNDPYYSFKETCPCCGYCPHCGRKNDPWYFGKTPYWGSPYDWYYYNPYITWTTSSGTK